MHPQTYPHGSSSLTLVYVSHIYPTNFMLYTAFRSPRNILDLSDSLQSITAVHRACRPMMVCNNVQSVFMIQSPPLPHGNHVSQRSRGDDHD